MKANEVRKSDEISKLFQGSIVRQRSSVELGWEGICVKRRTIEPGERPEDVIDHHYVVLWDMHSAFGERVGNALIGEENSRLTRSTQGP